MENVIAQHITKTPGICGGHACIAGHRIRVQDIVVLHEMHGMSAKQILEQYPTITLADIYAALAYYYDHRDEIEEEFRKADEWAERIKREIPSKIPAALREKLGGRCSRGRGSGFGEDVDETRDVGIKNLGVRS